MPERITVIRLSQDERDTLRAVTSREEVSALSKAVTAALRVGGEQSRAVAGALESDPVALRSLRDDLNARLDALRALPVSDEAKAPLTGRTQDALRVVEECLSMLGG